MKMTKTTLSVPEIHCGSCEALIKMWLKKLPGVKNVSVSWKSVTVEHDASLDKSKIVKQIKDTTWYSASYT